MSEQQFPSDHGKQQHDKQPFDEQNCEQLSALMDAEVTELELRRSLKSVTDSPELLQKWRRYQVCKDVIKGNMRGQDAIAYASLDLSAAVAQAISAEPSHKGAAADNSWWRNFKPVANMAVAASVSAAAVLGWQQWAANESTPAQPQFVHQQQVATQPNQPRLSLVQAPVTGRSDFRTVASGGQPVTLPVMQSAEIVRMPPAADQRLNQYLISHSGNAALNTASGSMSYTRVVHLAP